LKRLPFISYSAVSTSEVRAVVSGTATDGECFEARLDQALALGTSNGAKAKTERLRTISDTLYGQKNSVALAFSSTEAKAIGLMQDHSRTGQDGKRESASIAS
jgi:hypothetical protein